MMMMMIRSAEKSFLFYLLQDGCPKEEDILGASGEGLGKKRRPKACPLE